MPWIIDTSNRSNDPIPKGQASDLLLNVLPTDYYVTSNNYKYQNTPPPILTGNGSSDDCYVYAAVATGVTNTDGTHPMTIPDLSLSVLGPSGRRSAFDMAIGNQIYLYRKVGDSIYQFGVAECYLSAWEYIARVKMKVIRGTYETANVDGTKVWPRNVNCAVTIRVVNPANNRTYISVE